MTLNYKSSHDPGRYYSYKSSGFMPREKPNQTDMKYGVYHNADLDGLACAAIMKKAFPDIELIGWNYGYEGLIKMVEPGSEVLMADVTLPRAEMIELNKVCELVVVDHHVSAWEDLLDIPFEAYVYEEGTAACELLWGYLNDGPPPMLVSILGAYDVWKGYGTFRWNKEIVPIQLYYQTNFTVEDVLAGMFIPINTALTIGRELVGFEKAQFARASRSLFPVGLGGRTFWAYNGSVNPGRFMNYIREEFGYDKLLVFHKKPDCWAYSLRSVEDSIVDIAKGFGGGGHAKAAGFVTKEVLESLL